jgi:ferric-dicitrate binding protein FerR (iron transport regulator)/TolA-binding protein
MVSSPDAPRRLTAGGAETPDELAMAALLSRVPAATPDDLAVERVWRRVTSPVDRPVRRPTAFAFPALALAAAFAIAFAIVFFRSPGPKVELALSSGGVFSTRLGESWRAGRGGEALAEAERVRTDAAGHALLRISGVATVLIGADSDVSLERLSHGTFLRLSRGTLTARVSKRRADEPFVVQTDGYTVKVVGTLFTVDQGPGDHTAVSVREGIVDVSDDGRGRVYRVTAGTRWTSEAVDAREPDRTPDPVRNLLEGGLQGRSSGELQGAFAALVAPKPVAPVARGNEPSPAPAPALAPAPGGSDTAREPTPVRADPFGPSSFAPGAGRTPVKERPSVSPRISPLAIVEPPVLPAPPSPPDPVTVVSVATPSVTSAPPLPAPPAPSSALATTADGPYTKGLALEAKGDLEGASRELARAADVDPIHGDLALYSLGRLAQRRLHDSKRALAAFRRYREQYPQGGLLPEVDFAILQLDVEAHEQTQALAESTRFLQAHPASERVDQVHLLRGNLLRDGDKCREALGDYAAIGSPALLDDALYSTAYCQQRLGDLARAATTLRDYLKRFPNGAHRSDAERALESSP